MWGTCGRSLSVALVLVVGTISSSARAEVQDRFGLGLLGRLNPFGAAVSIGVMRRWTQPDEEGPLAQGRYSQAGINLAGSPASFQLGPRLEWTPLAIVTLQAGYDLYRFNGAFGSLLKVSDDSAPFGQDDLAALSGQERTGFAHRILLKPTLRARWQRMVFVGGADLVWYWLSSETGTYYEAEYDTLLREHDLLFQWRFLALAELWREGRAALRLGPAYEQTAAVRTGVQRDRLGAVLAWNAYDPGWGIDQLRLGVTSGVDLVDRNRGGQLYLALGLGVDFEL